MRILVAGAGPAGLLLARLVRRQSRHEVVLCERKSPEDEKGLGIVLGEGALDWLRRVDADLAGRIERRTVEWEGIDVQNAGETVLVRGTSFRAVPRDALLEELGRACMESGVELRWNVGVDAASLPPSVDWVVAADGSGSSLRDGRRERFGTSRELHEGPFLWLRARRRFERMTFLLRSTEQGSIFAHAYPFDARSSTFIVQSDERSYERLLRDASVERRLEVLSALFDVELEDAGLGWQRFATVRNRTLRDGRLVLVGDAAHTVHFSIGCGTRLALEGAARLARALVGSEDVERGLLRYEVQYGDLAARLQDVAARSARFFEGLHRFRRESPRRVAFAICARAGRLSYADLRRSEPTLARDLAVELAGHTRVAPARPSLAPLSANGLRLRNRLVAYGTRSAEAPSATPDDVRARPGLVLVREETDLDERARDARLRGAALGLELPSPRDGDLVGSLSPGSRELQARLARAHSFGVAALLLQVEPHDRDRALDLLSALRLGLPASIRLGVAVASRERRLTSAVLDGILDLAREARERGADAFALETGPGGTTSATVDLAQAVRLETRLVTMVTTATSELDEIDTMLAAGQADLVGSRSAADPTS